MPTAPAESARYWQHDAVPGVDLLRARYITHRYARHSHETFTVGVIEAGVEEFAYGSELLRAGPGTVALLNPEVVHTGQAGVPEGWAYRVLYPSVGLVTGIAAELGAAPGTPSFPRTVVDDPVTGWPPPACSAPGSPGFSAPMHSSVMNPTSTPGTVACHPWSAAHGSSWRNGWPTRRALTSWRRWPG